MHVARLGEGECLTHEARKPLPEGVDTTLDVASLALLLAGSLVLLLGDHLLVGFPEITVAGCPAPVTADESYYLLASPGESLDRRPARPTLYRFYGKRRSTIHPVPVPEVS